MRLDIVEAARFCLGTPWALQGRTPGKDGAMDCGGLIIVAGKRVRSIEEGYDFTAYLMGGEAVDAIASWEASGILSAQLRPIDLQDAEDGDVVLSTFSDTLAHAGILAEGGRTVIHASAKVGLVVEGRRASNRHGVESSAFRYRPARVS